jgi:hypothetical protein
LSLAHAASALLLVVAFSSGDRARYQEEIKKSRAWLDALSIDPIELRAHGIKGKKKLVEALDAYESLLKVSPKAERPALMKRIRGLAAVTYEDRYHDMLSIDDRAFKEDATSYLRAAVLLERMGLDTKRYRRKIAQTQPRLDQHLKSRGPNQRRVFHTYYAHFGLKEPFPLEDALADGIIAHRRELAALRMTDAYDLTHEVYAVYDFGDRLDVDPFSAEDKAYLRATLDALIERYAAQKQVDIVAELLTSEHYLRFQDSPSYAKAMSMLLANQNRDGSFGDYESLRPKFGDYVKQGFYLHTTLVAMGALLDVFEHPMPKPR